MQDQGPRNSYTDPSSTRGVTEKHPENIHAALIPVRATAYTNPLPEKRRRLHDQKAPWVYDVDNCLTYKARIHKVRYPSLLAILIT